MPPTTYVPSGQPLQTSLGRLLARWCWDSSLVRGFEIFQDLREQSECLLDRDGGRGVRQTPWWDGSVRLLSNWVSSELLQLRLRALVAMLEKMSLKASSALNPAIKIF